MANQKPKTRKKRTTTDENKIIEGTFTPSTSSAEELSIVPQAENSSIVPQAEDTSLTHLTSSSITRFPEPIQKAITETASKIDVIQIEKVMAYGEAPLLRAFENAGRILSSRQGSTADQQVIRQVLELSKDAKQNYEDFNLAIQEPGILQKLLLKLFSSMKDKHDKDLKVKAVTNYKLLEQLKDSCDAWLDTLKKSFSDISLSQKNDQDTCEEIEQYIVAGRIAEERITQEVEAARQTYETSGLSSDKQKYEDMKRGLSALQIVLLNLEKSRAASLISMGQLDMQLTTNQNIQIAVHTQRAHSMKVAAEQLRNAVLNAENSLALESQKSITLLNSELMKKVSEGTVLTAEESEKALLCGVFTNEAALYAAQTVVAGCRAIAAASDERVEKISQELETLKSTLNELAPVVTERRLSADNSKKTPTTPAGKLVF